MFKKFPSIEQLHSVSRLAMKNEVISVPKYIGKIKLHGTNACVRIEQDGSIIAQKRHSDVFPNDDNCGFAAWVRDNKDWFKKTFPVSVEGPTYVYGEWAGAGIQKGDAVSQCPKMFYVFLIKVGNQYIIEMNEESFLTSHPDVRWIHTHMTMYNFPFIGDNNHHIENIKKEVELIGKCDPLIQSLHGVQGPGEGLVFYPIPFNPDYMFKVKTEHHQVNQRLDKSVISYTPEQVAGIQEFSDKFVTEPRLNQGLTELGESFSIKDTGRFIGWVCKDIHKEAEAELEVSKDNIEWKDVAAVVSNKARAWFLNKVSTGSIN